MFSEYQRSHAEHKHPDMRRRTSLAALLTLVVLIAANTQADGAKLTDAHMAMLAAGDPAQVKKAIKKCAKCHGDTGVSDDDEIPHLVGLDKEYLFRQLLDFKADLRDGGRMNKLVRKLDDEELASLAVFYSANTLPAVAGVTLPAKPPLVSDGDAGRGLKPCAECHGADGMGKRGEYNSPVLAGMPYDYFVSTMQGFQDGSRANDPDGVMREVAKAVSADEVAALAEYYMALGERKRMNVD